MTIRKPKKLEKGDLIGVISPASNPPDISRIDKGVKYLESLGYNVLVGKNVGADNGYLAGTDEQRAEDLNSMFENKEVKAIFCIRGGYGSGRLLDKINYNAVRNNPKIFVGYSDITALQLAFFKKAGLVTFAGPMVAVDMYEKFNPKAEEIFWNTFTNSRKLGKIINPGEEKFFILNKGRAEGTLLGGNLAVFASQIGTPYIPNFKESILMFEEIGELPYRIDRYFNQITKAKIVEQSNGLILGRFLDCYEPDETKPTLSLNEVIGNYLGNIDKPVIYNVKHGHIAENITLPFGVHCKINASRSFIEIPDRVVE